MPFIFTKLLCSIVALGLPSALHHHFSSFYFTSWFPGLLSVTDPNEE